jgi:hypothetical protein
MRTLVESDLALLDVILTEADENSVLSSLSSDYYGVTSICQRSHEEDDTTHRKRPRVSMVFGWRMATELSSEGLSSTINRLGLSSVFSF